MAQKRSSFLNPSLDSSDEEEERGLNPRVKKTKTNQDAIKDPVRARVNLQSDSDHEMSSEEEEPVQQRRANRGARLVSEEEEVGRRRGK